MRLSTTECIRRELEVMADSRGIFSSSVPNLARKLEVSESTLWTALSQLKKSGALIVIRERYNVGGVNENLSANPARRTAWQAGA
jgi:biotin operon repressor